jgi:hypothetical protein
MAAHGALAFGVNGEPLNYPTPLLIRNTFIAVAGERPFALDEFFEERRVRSCPVSGVEQDDTNGDADNQRRGCATKPTAAAACVAALASSRLQQQLPPKCSSPLRDPEVRSECSTTDTPTFGTIAAAVQREPVHGKPGCQEFTSRGSFLHYRGDCKPCAFLHTKGCENGFECPFCHICDPGEKKKRMKDRKGVRKAVGRERNNQIWPPRLGMAAVLPAGLLRLGSH